MEPSAFEKKYMSRFNAQQRKAVRQVDGPVLLLAVPGSGKTTVLVTRLGYMALCCGIKPEEILTVTYTVAATGDMRARCAEHFGEDLAKQFEFRTINSICAKIIQYYGRQYDRSPFALVSDEKQITALLSAVYQEVQREYPTESDLKSVRTLITCIKNMMLTDEEVRQLAAKLEEPINIAEIYQKYCRAMRENQWMDYDDQMIYAYRMLCKHPQILRHFQQRYRYFCVDEAQDTSKIQHAILAFLASASGNLFMVGDEDQSIYGFRAAYPQALLDFEQDHPGAKVLLMEENFRSDTGIVQAADRFIQKNTFRHVKRMKAARGSSASIREIPLRSRGQQYTYLARVAADCDRQTAVLYRDNECALPLIDLLERNGIDYRMRQMEMTFFSHRIVSDLTCVLRLAIDPYDTEAFLQVYYKLGTYIKKADAQHIAELSRQRHMPVLDAALECGRLNAHALAGTKTLRTHLRNMLNERADKALYRITEYLGYADYLTRSGINGENKLAILRTLASREASPATFLARMEALQEIIQQKETNPDCQVHLSTIHASKGLEYDTVYLMDVIDGILPEQVPASQRFASKKEKEIYEEERRLFYVGVTRAKNRLYLFTANRKSTFCEDFFGKGAKKQAIDFKALKSTSSSTQTDNARREEICRQFHEQFDVGSIVTHFKFGEGVILKITEKQIVVQFADKTRRLDLFLTAQKQLVR